LIFAVAISLLLLKEKRKMADSKKIVIIAEA